MRRAFFTWRRICAKVSSFALAAFFAFLVAAQCAHAAELAKIVRFLDIIQVGAEPERLAATFGEPREIDEGSFPGVDAKELIWVMEVEGVPLVTAIMVQEGRIIMGMTDASLDLRELTSAAIEMYGPPTQAAPDGRGAAWIGEETFTAVVPSPRGAGMLRGTAELYGAIAAANAEDAESQTQTQ